MQIFVRLPGGKIITIDLVAGMTVHEIKKSVEKKEGTSIGQQSLILNGQKLENDRTVEDCGIKNESTLYLIINKAGTSQIENEGFQVTVMISEKDNIFVDVKPSTTVKELKNQIVEKSAVDKGGIEIHYGKLKLDNPDQTMEELQLTEGSILHVSLKVRGG